MFVSSILKKCGIVALVVVAGAVESSAATAAGNDLVRNSPFVPEGWSAPRPQERPRGPQPPAQAQPLDKVEFRGIAKVNGEASFSLFDPTKQRSYWLKLNKPDSGFTVVEYKAKEDAVVVRHEGNSRTISLHEAKVQAMAAPPPTQQPTPAAGNAQAATTPEARMQDLADEIRRRRAIRRALVEGREPPEPGNETLRPDDAPPIPPSPEF